MTLKEQLMKDMQDSMRSGDELRKETLRMARAAVKNAEMARSAQILEMVANDDPAAQGPMYDQIRDLRKIVEEYKEEENPTEAEKERARVASTEISTILAGNSEFDDKGVQDVLRKEIKQRQDSMEAYTRAKRQDLADKELAEVAILEVYLPRQMSEAEIETEVRAVITELGASGPQDMSKVMPAAMSRLKGKADGRTVNQVVTRLLAET